MTDKKEPEMGRNVFEELEYQTEVLTSLPYGSDRWRAQRKRVDRLAAQVKKRNEAAADLIRIRDEKLLPKKDGKNPSVRDVFRASIHLSTLTPLREMTWATAPETLPWNVLRGKRRDIDDSTWARLVKAANEEFTKAKTEWDAIHIPNGTTAEIDAADYASAPRYMQFLHQVVAEHNTQENL